MEMLERATPPKLGVLDLARAGAAYWVLAAHLIVISGTSVRFLGDGWLAVDLFIFISGFLMYLVLRGERTATPRGAASFYVRRFFRLAPCFYIAILLYVGFRGFYVDGLVRAESYFATVAPVSSYVGEVSRRDVLAHLTFLHGLIPGKATRIFGPAWSLSLEVQFYAVAPVCAVCLARSPWVSLVAAFAINWVGNDLFGVYGTHGRMADYFFPSFLPNRLFMFALGAVCCRYLMTRAPGDLRLFAATVVGCALLFPWESLVFCFGLAGLVVAATVVRTHSVIAVNRLATAAPVRLLADWSYGVYLLHQFAMGAVGNIVFTPATASWSRTALGACYTGLVVILSTGAAAILFYSVESPVRGWGKRLADRYLGVRQP